MDENLKIFLSDLEDGQAQELDVSVSPEFLDVEEGDLSFADPVHVKGKVYLAGDEVVACLTASTNALMPCKVCNEKTKVPLKIDQFYHAIPHKQMTQGYFDCGTPVREGLLMEVPIFAECGGRCSKRDLLEKYAGEADDTYCPFADLSLELEE